MIIILSKTFQNQNILENVIIMSSKSTLIDDFHLKTKNDILEFDYLLCDDLSLLDGFENTDILMDDEPVCNFFGQTSLEHIYIGNLENSLDHLINGE